jgi:membrane carboxypeptidase/penicillin-binding protein
MRKIARLTLAVLACVLLAAFGGLGWFFFYSGDLPDISRLRDFAPTNRLVVVDDCLEGPVTAIPYDQIGKNLRDAVASAEYSHGTAHVSVLIARGLFCHSHDKPLIRHLKETRTKLQLDRRYSEQELLTIYLNRVAMGECGSGVEAASQRLFHKPAVDLSPAQAALIAGMIRSPSGLSPVRHPERAMARRNEVLDAMAAAGTLSQDAAKSAKTEPLLN